MNFVSDNTVGASATVLEAIARANDGPLPAYGTDERRRRVEGLFRDVFERDCAVFPVTTGTAANALALAAAVPPYGLAVCHRESHVIDDECGAPEFFTHGAKLPGLPGVGGQLAAADVAAASRAFAKVKQMPPRALSISQVSECGTVYSPSEIAALSQMCRAAGLALHMDGARFANALVALGCSTAEMASRVGALLAIAMSAASWPPESRGRDRYGGGRSRGSRPSPRRRRRAGSGARRRARRCRGRGTRSCVRLLPSSRP